MRIGVRLILTLILTGCLAEAADIPAALAARMDQMALVFKSFSADLKEVDHTAIVNDDATLNGIFRMRRVRPGDTRLLIDYKGPDARTIAFEGEKGQIFYPKINTVQVYQVGARRGLVDQFLLLGFGAGSSELRAAYEVTYAGTENIAGAPAHHLKLSPKSTDISRYMKQADLWVDDATGLPVQQKFLTSAAGDFKLVTYSKARLNPPLSEKDLRLNPPKGALVQIMPR